MDLYFFLVMGHILGVAFGVGGATASDVIFLRSVKEGVITAPAYGILKAVSLVLWAGILLTIVSGLSFLAIGFQATGQFPLLADPVFLAKLTGVAAIVVNGLIFHYFVFPTIKKSIDVPLGQSELTARRPLFAVSGAVSIVSWYAVFILAFMRGVVEIPYLLLLGIYVVAIAGAALAASLVLQHLIKRA